MGFLLHRYSIFTCFQPSCVVSLFFLHQIFHFYSPPARVRRPGPFSNPPDLEGVPPYHGLSAGFVKGIMGGGGDITKYLAMRNTMYLAEAVHTIKLIRNIGLLYNTNSPNHLPYNSLHTAFCVPPLYYGVSTCTPIFIEISFVFPPPP